jgi:hypothetical protein
MVVCQALVIAVLSGNRTAVRGRRWGGGKGRPPFDPRSRGARYAVSTALLSAAGQGACGIVHVAQIRGKGLRVVDNLLEGANCVVVARADFA